MPAIFLLAALPVEISGYAPVIHCLYPLGNPGYAPPSRELNKFKRRSRSTKDTARRVNNDIPLLVYPKWIKHLYPDKKFIGYFGELLMLKVLDCRIGPLFYASHTNKIASFFIHYRSFSSFMQFST